MTLLTKFRSWIGGTSPMQDLVDPEIEEYAAAHSVAESDVCRLIREETYRTQDCPQMVVGPLEAAFLKVWPSSCAHGGFWRSGPSRGTARWRWRRRCRRTEQCSPARSTPTRRRSRAATGTRARTARRSRPAWDQRWRLLAI